MTTLTSAPSGRPFVERVGAAALDPFESQAVFRTLLDCLARPGSLRSLPPALLNRVPAALLPVLALADVDVSVAVAEPPAPAGSDSWADVIVAVTGAPVSDTSTARFVVAMEPPSAAMIEGLRRGSASAPEDGARLTVSCRSIRIDERCPDETVAFGVRGPGVVEERTISLAGVDAKAIEALCRVNAERPAGIDTWFVADDGAVVGVPRSSRIGAVERHRLDPGTTNEGAR